MAATAAARTFDDFEPATSLKEKPGEVALRVDLSGEGFRKEQIRVLIDNYGKLRIRGERPTGADGVRWRRFSKDFTVPAGCDAASIRARLDKDGVLHITMPRLAPAAPPVAAAGASTGGGAAGGGLQQDHKPAGETSAQQAAGTAAAEDEDDKGQEEDAGGAPMDDRPDQDDDEQRPSSDNAAAAPAPAARPAAYGFAKDRRSVLLAIFAVVLALVAAGLSARFRLMGPSAETAPPAGNHTVSVSLSDG